jgi:hypothetical protein
MVDVTGHASGTGPRGRDFERDGDYVFTWDAATSCVSLDGDWATDVEGARWTTAVRGYSRCAGACPAAGGSIAWSSALARLTVTYDGSSTASWSADARRDRTGTIELLCD